MAALDHVMRRSGMSASDDERLEMVASCYAAAQTYVRAVTDAVTRVNTIHQEVERWRRTDDGRGEERAGADLMSGHEEWLGEGIRSMAEAHINLAALSTAIRAVPNPASAEARNSRASLMQALRLYIRCARRLRKLLSDLGGKFGKNYARGGFYETRWTAMETASLKRLVGSAGKHFETAARLMDGEGCETRLVRLQPIPTPHSFDSSATIALPSAQSEKTDESRRQGGEHECLDERAEVDSLNCPAPSSDSAGDAEPLPLSGHTGSGASVGGRDMAQESLLQMLEELAGRVRSLEREKSEVDAKMEALERGEREAVARVQELEHQKKQAAATIEELERAERQAAATIEAFERGEQQAAAAMQELEREKQQAAVTIRGLEREVGELGALITLAAEKVDEILKVGADDDVSQPQAVAAPARSKVPRQLGEFSAATQSEPKERSSKPWRSD